MKLKVEGKWVEGEEVDFTPEEEPWTVYELSDGSTLRIRTVVTTVIRTDQYNEDGSPLYVVKSKNVVGTETPDRLWRSPEDAS